MEKLYYNNTLVDWIIAIALVLAAVLLGRVVYWLFKSWLLKLVRKTKAGLDDVIVDMAEEPVTVMLVLIGVRAAINTLRFDADTGRVLQYSFQFAMILSVTWLVARLYESIHRHYLTPLAQRSETDLDDHLLPWVRTGVKLAVWLLGIIVALNNAGYDVTAILAGLGIGGLALALGIQHVFSNIISGVQILVDRHFSLGDRIQLHSDRCTIDGTVLNIGLRTTRIRTRYEGRVVNVPNSMLTSRDVVNVETETGRQMFTVFRLANTTAPETLEQFLAALQAIVASCEGAQEKVVTGVVGVGEVSIDVMFLYWIKPEASKIQTRTAINLNVLRRMKELGVQFSERSRLHYNSETRY